MCASRCASWPCLVVDRLAGHFQQADGRISVEAGLEFPDERFPQ
jgi:hypothetical protein